jgi:hypothetical protein
MITFVLVRQGCADVELRADILKVSVDGFYLADKIHQYSSIQIGNVRILRAKMLPGKDGSGK